MKGYLLLLAIALLPFAVLAQGFKPVNKDASPEATKLLSFLYNIKGRHILSGQQNYNNDLNTFSDSAKAISGKSPAIWGSDFMLWGDKDLGQKLVNEAIKKWQDGYIVTIMWHQGRPTDKPPYDWKNSIQGKLTDAEWDSLTTPNTALNKKWLDEIDYEARYLKQLRDAHVPVLWRPYHEMNGVWFWWGDKKGDNGIAKLWKIMYERYTNYHHLNNLLWVWGANGLRDIPLDEAYDYKLYYPGADYVDILGADVYHFDYEQSDYDALLKLANGKPIALTETGELPKPEILKAQPEWAWFMVWTSWLWTDNTHDRVKEVYNLQQTLNHDEVKTMLNQQK
jgi:mannan endo-1,4-beta-mannosidase